MIKSKYHSERVSYYGMEFASKKELNRYLELKCLQKAGKIGSINRQIRYELIPSQKGEDGKVIERPCYYWADFVYQDYEKGELIVEDAKGVRTKDYIIKRKLMLYVHGIRISEV